MQNIDCFKQFSDKFLCLHEGHGSFTICELIGKDFVTEFEYAVYFFGARVFIFENVKQPHELLVIDKLS